MSLETLIHLTAWEYVFLGVSATITDAAFSVRAIISRFSAKIFSMIVILVFTVSYTVEKFTGLSPFRE